MSEEVKEEIEALMSIYEEDMQSKKILQSSTWNNLKVPGQDSIQLSCSHKIRQTIKRLRILHFHDVFNQSDLTKDQEKNSEINKKTSNLVKINR